MSGTDSTQQPIIGGPRVILIEPQLGENIGAAARAIALPAAGLITLSQPQSRVLQSAVTVIAYLVNCHRKWHVKSSDKKLVDKFLEQDS